MSDPGLVDNANLLALASRALRLNPVLHDAVHLSSTKKPTRFFAQVRAVTCLEGLASGTFRHGSILHLADADLVPVGGMLGCPACGAAGPE